MLTKHQRAIGPKLSHKITQAATAALAAIAQRQRLAPTLPFNPSRNRAEMCKSTPAEKRALIAAEKVAAVEIGREFDRADLVISDQLAAPEQLCGGGLTPRAAEPVAQSIMRHLLIRGADELRVRLWADYSQRRSFFADWLIGYAWGSRFGRIEDPYDRGHVIVEAGCRYAAAKYNSRRTAGTLS
jgi:hypothetical protein